MHISQKIIHSCKQQRQVQQCQVACKLGVEKSTFTKTKPKPPKPQPPNNLHKRRRKLLQMREVEFWNGKTLLGIK